MTSSLCAQAGRERTLVCLPLLIRTWVLLDKDPIFMTSFNLNCLHEGPVFIFHHIEGWGFNTGILEEHSSFSNLEFFPFPLSSGTGSTSPHTHSHTVFGSLPLECTLLLVLCLCSQLNGHHSMKPYRQKSSVRCFPCAPLALLCMCVPRVCPVYESRVNIVVLPHCI